MCVIVETQASDVRDLVKAMLDIGMTCRIRHWPRLWLLASLRPALGSLGTDERPLARYQ